MPQAPVTGASLKLTGSPPGYTLSNSVSFYPMVPVGLVDHGQWLFMMSHVVNGLMHGRSNNTGFITLKSGSATTTVTLPSGSIGPSTFVLLCPLTASAATEYGAGSIYLSARDPLNNTFTLTHVNSGTTDRRFGFILVG